MIYLVAHVFADLLIVNLCISFFVCFASSASWFVSSLVCQLVCLSLCLLCACLLDCQFVC